MQEQPNSTLHYWSTSEGTHLVLVTPPGIVRQVGVLWLDGVAS
jgi:hypothetical protein